MAYYGNSAPYAFSYNPQNGSDAYRYNNNYGRTQVPQGPRVAGSAPGAYYQGYGYQSQPQEYGSRNGNNYNSNYAPSISSSTQGGAYGGIAPSAPSGGYWGAAAASRGPGSDASRWSVGSGEPREKVDESVPTMMDKGQFSLNEVTVARNIKEYRREYRGQLWTRGSRWLIFGRFFCFFIMIVIYLLISGVLGLALYIRPPSATFMKPSADTNDIQFRGQGLTVPLSLNISIWNPNFIKASVKKVHVDLFYPINNEERPIGNGTIYDIWIHSNDRTNFTFPIDIDYDFSKDPNLDILRDLADRCALNNEGLSLKAKAMVAANVLSINVATPTVPISINIACPFNQQQLLGFVQGGLGNILGVDLSGLGQGDPDG